MAKERADQTQRLLITGLIVILALYLMVWKALTHGTIHDPVFLFKEMIAPQEKKRNTISPPRSLHSWKETLQGNHLNNYLKAEPIFLTDPRRAGRLLWPIAMELPHIRPSISYMYLRQALDALGSQKHDRALALATMATEFNPKDFWAHEAAWRAASELKKDDVATAHYQKYLESRPNIQEDAGGGVSAGTLLFLILVGGAVGVISNWKKLRLQDRLDAWLISDLAPPPGSRPTAPPPPPGGESVAPPPPDAGSSEEIHKLGEERKKSITGILSAEAFLQDVQRAFDGKNYEKGVDLCVKAVEMNPSNSKKVSSICMAEGIRLFEVGDFANAKELLEVALHFEPHVLEAHTCLGNCFIKLGDFDKAREQYEKVIEVDPKNGDAYYTLGVCYQKVNDIPRAKRSFEVAVQIKDHPNSHFYLAKLLETERNYAAAITHWTRFVELAPASPQAEAARGRLAKLASLAGAGQ